MTFNNIVRATAGTRSQPSIVFSSSLVNMLRLMATAFILIVILSSDKVAASTLSNHYTRKAASTAFRRTTNRGFGHRTDPVTVERSRRRLRRDMNDCSINLWNFRTISNVQVRPPFHHRHRFMAAAAVGSSLKTGKRVKNPHDDPDHAPTLEEMRAQLGLFGSFIANSVEVGVSTAGSYVSGGLFGYVVGVVMNTPGAFRNNPPPLPPPTGTGLPLLPPDANQVGRTLWNRISTLNSQSVTRAKSWGQLSAAFSGFHALTRVCRGGTEDHWNGVIGSACAGAYLNRSGGPMAMVKGAGTYGGFTYMIDTYFGGKGKGKDGAGGKFDFDDTRIEDRGF